MSKQRVFSGVQPTGNLHLGNYLGAIKNWVKMQDEMECIFGIMNLHAITVPQDPKALRQSTREVTAALIACGIDPNKSIIMVQSTVRAHAELAWILNCHTPLGWLNRMTQFKEKSNQSRSGVEKLIKDTKKIVELLEEDKNKFQTFQTEQMEIDKENYKWRKDKFAEGAHYQDSNKTELLKQFDDIADRKHAALTEYASSSWKIIESDITILKETIADVSQDLNNASNAKLGLYSYPVLMAADILAYKATHVPVGEDQKQHLELARDIAGAFNRFVGEDFFPLPEPKIMPQAARIMSLNDGTRKMSKSEESEYSRINLTDDADTIANKFKKAQTDSDASLTFDKENRPSVANLITIYAALDDSTPEKVVEQFSTLKTGQFKAQLADLAVAKLSPITARMRELMQDEAELDALLARGKENAAAIAEPILKATMEKIGLLAS